MRIKRQKQFGLGSKVLALISPGAWNAKELCKLQSADELEYRKNRLKMAARGFFAPWSARNKLKKAQELYKSGADNEIIKANTELKTGRAILGGIAGGPVRGIGNTLARIRGLRTKYGKFQGTRVNYGDDNSSRSE